MKKHASRVWTQMGASAECPGGSTTVLIQGICSSGQIKARISPENSAT